MVTLQYTFEEMVKSLTKIGYEVKLEYLEADWYDTRSEEDIGQTRRTYMVYFAGECVTNGSKFARLYGSDRMSEIFELELRKRVLSLF